MPSVTLPNNYRPRPYQLPFWRYMEGGGDRYTGVWHRRAGKDHTALSWLSKASFQRVGLYWHVFPTAKQGQDAIWTGADNQGKRFLDFWPPELIKSKRDDNMRLELANGSIYQIVGAAGQDGSAKHLRGANPVGLIFSEPGFYSNDSESWDTVRPALAANNGWAAFISTPSGRNWFYDLYKQALTNPRWGTDLLTVDDTKDVDGNPVVTQLMIDDDRASGMSEAMIEQEYYCSFDAPFVGAIWGDEITRIRDEGRICEVRYDPYLPVETWWDIGINDPGAIWYVQKLGDERRFIGYEQATDMSLHEWARQVQNHEYVYSRHIGPWDLRAREQSTGKTREAFLSDVGLNIEVSDKTSLGDGINEVRAYLRQKKVFFDMVRCEEGIQSLSQYRWKRDRHGMPMSTPEHDQYSHGADAFRTGVMNDDGARRVEMPPAFDSDYDVLANPSEWAAIA